MLRCSEEERAGGGGKPRALKILLLRRKEVKRFYSLSFCDSALHPYTPLLSFWFVSSSSLLVPLGVLWPPLRPWCGARRVFLLASRPCRSVGRARLPGLGPGAEKGAQCRRGSPSTLTPGIRVEFLPKKIRG